MSEGKLSLDLDRAAFLFMDFQRSIVQMAEHERSAAAAARAGELLAAVRRAGRRVIHVKVGFRDGYPEASPRNLGFQAILGAQRFLPNDPGAEFHPAVAPEPGEVVVVKRRVGAFSGTDLQLILNAREVNTLVLSGIATSGVILSTLRHAADADYRICVVGDGCADRDPEVHRVLLEKVFPRQATVVTAAEVAAALGSAESL